MKFLLFFILTVFSGKKIFFIGREKKIFFNFSVYSFRLPIPFGEINFTKTPDGETQFGIGSNVNIGGSGAESNLQFSKKKNGTAQVQSKGKNFLSQDLNGLILCTKNFFESNSKGTIFKIYQR